MFRSTGEDFFLASRTICPFVLLMLGGCCISPTVVSLFRSPAG